MATEADKTRGKRGRIDTSRARPGGSRYVRRDSEGQFTEDQVDVRRSMAAGGRARAKTTSLKGSTFEAAFRRLPELARLEPDWDGEGGVPPTAVATATAAHLLQRVAALPNNSRVDIAPFAISPLGHGGLQLEWRWSGRYFEVEIGPDGRLAYLLVTGDGVDRESEELDDAALDRVLLSLTRVLKTTRAA